MNIENKLRKYVTIFLLSMITFWTVYGLIVSGNLRLFVLFVVCLFLVLFILGVIYLLLWLSGEISYYDMIHDNDDDSWYILR